MKRIWWLLCTAIAAVLLSLCFFGVRLRLAPRLVLSQALGTALTELDTRFEKSPAHLLGAALDREGRQKAVLQMETQSEQLGIVRYDMTVQTQLTPCRVKAAGTVITGGKPLDLSLYLDQNFAAVCSYGLLDGKYYGITYGSFSRDIRNRELLAALIGEKIINQWEESVSGLQRNLSRKISLPEFSLGDVPGMLYGLLVLKPQTGREKIMISGHQENAYTVSFRTTGAEIVALAANYLDRIDPSLRNLVQKVESVPDTAVSAVFYLHEQKLVRISAVLEQTEFSARIQVELGAVPVEDPLRMELEIQSGEDLNRYSVSMDTKSDEEHYAETLSLVQTKNGVQSSGQLDYNWDFSTGEMKLTAAMKDRKAEMRLNLEGKGDTLTIRTQDAAPILNLLLKKNLKYPLICTLRLSPGSIVTAPEYLSLNQWSMEDILTILTALGSLLGLKMP